MDLNEFAVGVEGALLEDSGLRRSGADDGVGALAEERAYAAGGEDDCVGGECAEFHGAEVHRSDAAADAFGVDDGGEKFPAFVLFDFAVGLVAADLLVERVEKLLTGGGAGECGAVIKSATESAEIEQAFRRAVEGNAHAIEQVDDGWGGFTHRLDGCLVGEEVAAIDGVVEVLVGSVAFAFEILGSVDTALGADRVGSFDGDDGEQVDVSACLCDFDDCCEPGQTSANYDDSGCCHCFLSQKPATSF